MTVYKMIECVGTSTTGVSDAIRAALRRVGAQVQGEEGEDTVYGPLRWFEVTEIRGSIDGAGPGEFQVKVSVASEMRVTEEALSATASRSRSRKTLGAVAAAGARGGASRRPKGPRGRK